MPEEYEPQHLQSDSPPPSAEAEELSQAFGELRELLLRGERRRLAELERRLDELGLTPEELAEVLPDAVALRTGQDRQLARSLAPTLQEAFSESVQRNPQHVAQAIFPVLGPAIRKAIAETMAGFVNTLNRAIESSLSIRGLRWRLEAWRTGVPYPQIVIKHALVYRVEQVFLIHRETGLPLAQVTAEDLETQDADLISGMLTAIRDFVQDSFGATDEGDGGLRTFSVGERTILVEQGPKALLAAVVKGQHPPTLLEKLQATLETIHLHFGSALTEFEGDSAAFETAKPLLEECLETVVSTDRSSTRGATPRVAWVVIAVVVVLLAAMWIRSTVRWHRAVAALEEEPGIVLVEVERGLFGGRLSGLVDPLAVSPSQLLLDARVDTSRVEVRWESYLSFDAPMVAARARRALDAPESVQLDLVADTLHATGTATFDWLSRAAALLGMVPGVAHLDISGVEATLPPQLAEFKRSIEERRILFNIGSSALIPPAPDLIDETAALVDSLIEAAHGVGYDVSVGLIGRTDTTGSNETNLVLGQRRADRVREALIARSVPGDLVTATGIGTSDPIHSENPQADPALNRSVSVEVTVTFGESGGGSEK